MQAITDSMLLKLPDFMASPNGRKNESQRPRPIHVSKSFSKLEPASPDRTSRSSRASTIQNGVIPAAIMSDKTNMRNENKTKEKSPQEDGASGTGDEVTGKLPADFDELPIELVSLSDRLVLIETFRSINSNLLQLH
jgi:hypothetical protein